MKITPAFVSGADGSCLIELGRTSVICTASFVSGVPRWRQESGLGWVTAEYGMLPGSTRPRTRRAVGRRDGRSVEIQRLIGRVLRSVVRFERLGRNTVYLDCDVLCADGGTRTASITGAWVALARAVDAAAGRGDCRPRAVAGTVAAVSVGMVDGRAMLDLDYVEDADAEVDMNVAMTGGARFVEIQGAAERRSFGRDQLDDMFKLAARGIRKLIRVQRTARRKGKRK